MKDKSAAKTFDNSGMKYSLERINLISITIGQIMVHKAK